MRLFIIVYVKKMYVIFVLPNGGNVSFISMAIMRQYKNNYIRKNKAMDF
jgi:hypothetical protein